MLPPKYDPLAPEALADPYPIYRQLRDSGPLCRGGPAQWVVTRYEDVAALLRDPRLSSEAPEEYHRIAVGDGAARAFRQRIVLDRDPPAHTELRRMLGESLRPPIAPWLRRRIQEMIDDLLRAPIERGAFDVVTDLAYPLPVMVVCEVIGIPESDREAVRPHAVALAKAFSLFLPEQDRGSVDAAVEWLRGYVTELLAERALRPRDDLLSRIAARGEQKRVELADVIDNVVFLLFAGFETTTNLISTGCDALLHHPDQLKRVLENPALLPAAVEEFLRYDAPVQVKARVARAPIEVGDRTIREGRVVVLLLGSANRDERKFENPDSLDVSRSPNPHVSFGGGIHACLGAALARLEAGLAFGALLKAGKLERTAAAIRRESSSFRGFHSVPVAIVPR